MPHRIQLLIAVLLIGTSCNGQQPKSSNTQAASNLDRVVGGRCEGCEAIYEYGNRDLSAVDTLPEYEQSNPKLKVTGTILQHDGRTPARDVILYIYHTNSSGVYPAKGNEKDWARRHGYLRGWIRTDRDGRYTFYTFRPASYPNSTIPAHIHAVVKEPGIKEYYIDDYNFSDDPYLSGNKNRNPRGGSGIVTLRKENGLFVAHRDIVLGLNVDGY